MQISEKSRNFRFSFFHSLSCFFFVKQKHIYIKTYEKLNDLAIFLIERLVSERWSSTFNFHHIGFKEIHFLLTMVYTFLCSCVLIVKIFLLIKLNVTRCTYLMINKIPVACNEKARTISQSRPAQIASSMTECKFFLITMFAVNTAFMIFFCESTYLWQFPQRIFLFGRNQLTWYMQIIYLN